MSILLKITKEFFSRAQGDESDFELYQSLYDALPEADQERFKMESNAFDELSGNMPATPETVELFEDDIQRALETRS